MSNENETQTTKFSLTDAFANGGLPITVRYEIDTAFLENLRTTLRAAHQMENLNARNAAMKALRQYADRKKGDDAILLLKALLNNPQGQSQENNENKDLAVLFLSAPGVLEWLAWKYRDKVAVAWILITDLKDPADKVKILSAPFVLSWLAYDGMGDEVLEFIMALKDPADQVKILSTPDGVEQLAKKGYPEAYELLESANQKVAARAEQAEQAPQPAPG